MASTSPKQRSLYRLFWRKTNELLPHARHERQNLRGLYRPQLRQLLLSDSTQWQDIEQKVSSTLFLLSHSPCLKHQLSSIHYHHTLDPRNQSKSLRWDPQHPEAAQKAFLAQQKRQAGRSELVRTVEEGAKGVVGRLMQRAEKANGVMLGWVGGQARTARAMR